MIIHKRVFKTDHSYCGKKKKLGEVNLTHFWYQTTCPNCLHFKPEFTSHIKKAKPKQIIDLTKPTRKNPKTGMWENY